MMKWYAHQFIVVDIPKCSTGSVIAEEPEVGEQLTEPNIGR